MIYGYCRVSTKAQEKFLREYGAQEIYKDSFTGTKADRPQLNILLAHGKLKEGDTLIVTKLDRIARSLSQGNDLVNELISRGVRVHIGNIGVMDNTPSSKLIRNIFFAFAEFERDMIIERTQEGKAIAKQDPSFREGRPKTHGNIKIDHALELLESKTYKQVENLTGISKSTLVRAKRAKRG